MNELTNSRFKGYIDGRRIYREQRGLWHIQDCINPNKAIFSGTLKEIEKGLHHKLIRVN